MPQFQFRIKAYQNETGEFTESFAADSGTILQLILQYWFNETLPNNLDIVVVSNERGDLLVIDHLKRDIFDYYFLPAGRKKTYFHKKTDIQFMFFVLESFFNSRYADLEVNLKEKDDDWRFVRGDLTGKSFVYKVDNRALWRNLNWIVLWFAFSIVLLLMGIISGASAGYLVFIVYFVVLSLLNLSQIRRFRQYYLDNKDVEIRFSRADPLLHIRKGSWSQAIPKTDIRQITKYIHAPDDARVLAEYYTEIEFHNGNILNLTSLLIPQIQIETKFANDNILFDVKVSSNGRLKRKTALDRYFSAIKPLPS